MALSHTAVEGVVPLLPHPPAESEKARWPRERGPPHLITWELATQGITPVSHVIGSGGRSHLREAYLVTYLLGKNIRIVACCNHLKQGVHSSKGSICF